jgi:hypothetical protein
MSTGAETHNAHSVPLEQRHCQLVLRLLHFALGVQQVTTLPQNRGASAWRAPLELGYPLALLRPLLIATGALLGRTLHLKGPLLSQTVLRVQAGPLGLRVVDLLHAPSVLQGRTLS